MDKVDFYQGIENALNAGSGNQKKEVRKTRGKTNVRDPRRSGFSQVLEHSILEKQDLGPLSEVTPSEEALESLLDTVRSAGDSLKKQPLPQEMFEYKKAVRDFLHYVVENGFEIHESQLKKKIYVRGEKRWEVKIHHQIQIVDRKLEELAAGILMKQINELDLKTRLEEITGLLVDFTVTGKINLDN